VAVVITDGRIRINGSMCTLRARRIISLEDCRYTTKHNISEE